MNNIRTIGIVVVVLVLVGFAVGNRGDRVPSGNDTGGFFEGGSMSGDAGANCQAACGALADKIKELKDARAKDLFEGAGCTEGSGGEWTGTMAGGYQYTCPTQSSAEALGEAIGNMKDNPSAKDREIKDLEKQQKDNCPCKPQPGAMVRIAPPYLIICTDGTSLSGSPMVDENGDVIRDAQGRYINADTGLSVQCP